MEIVHVPTLETERLLLRSFRQRDIGHYAALYGDPEVLRHLGGGCLVQAVPAPLGN